MIKPQQSLYAHGQPVPEYLKFTAPKGPIAPKINT
jgi:hypothetical protein